MYLSEADKKKYLKNPNHCPHCESDNIQGEGFNVRGYLVTQYVMCNDCENDWTDIYKLINIEE